MLCVFVEIVSIQVFRCCRPLAGLAQVIRLNIVKKAGFPSNNSSGWSRGLYLHVQSLHVAGVLLLRHDFARIELDQHGAIRF